MGYLFGYMDPPAMVSGPGSIDLTHLAACHGVQPWMRRRNGTFTAPGMWPCWEQGVEQGVKHGVELKGGKEELRNKAMTGQGAR